MKLQVKTMQKEMFHLKLQAIFLTFHWNQLRAFYETRGASSVYKISPLLLFSM